MPKRTIAVLAVLMLGVVGAASKYKPGGDTAAATGPEAETAGETGASADCVDQTGGDATITISGFAYDVTCLTVSASNGITIVNEDPSAHSFTVEGGVIDETLDAGQTAKGGRSPSSSRAPRSTAGSSPDGRHDRGRVTLRTPAAAGPSGPSATP